MVTSAEEYYRYVAGKLSEKSRTNVADFYEDWDASNVINLKFRQLKCFGLDIKRDAGYWFNLHRTLNQRRFYSETFANSMRELIHDHRVIPLRIFHSIAEWLAPNELGIQEHHHPRLVKSGYLALENDTSLQISLETAQEIIETPHESVGDPVILYTGNKSIHVWLPFELEDFVEEDDRQKLAYGQETEKFDQSVRYQIFRHYQSMVSHELDKRMALDTRRIVPLIDSLNAITGRRVIQLTKEEVFRLSPEEVQTKASEFKFPEITVIENRK